MEKSSQPIEIQNYVNGKFQNASSNEIIDSLNPATTDVLCKVPRSNEHDVDQAVDAAAEAFESWSQTDPSERSRILYAIADAIEKRLDEFAEAESRDQGKPIWLARSVDIPRAVYNFRFFAGAILHHSDMSTSLDAPNCVNYVQRMPIGVAGLITPWNLPLYLLTWKIAPALATGNTVVAKPSEFTSLTAFMLSQVMHELQVPPGVCNFVYGYGGEAGKRLVEHPNVPIISFTGGTATGKIISSLAAPFHKKLSLELGGKNPAVIFPDVDIDHVVSQTIRSSFTNQGEICLCTSRIYVHRDIFDPFVEKLVEAVRAIKVGPAWEADTKMAALVSEQHFNKVKSYVEIAKEEGGNILCGHGVDELVLPDELKNGYFMRPTVITGLTDDSRLVKEEIFGPVIVVLPFEEETEVIRRSNDSPYGLSACVWSKDGSIAQRVARKLHAGTVWVNCWMMRDLRMPFGGVKGSGVGREGASYSINFYTEQKTVCTNFA